MKTRFSIFTASLTGAGLLAAAVFASVQQNSLAASTPVDPAHAAHVAAGTMPPDAPAGDPALTQQLAELQAKVIQLQASLAKGASPAAAAAMPGMPAATPPAAPAPAPPMAMGMGKMKPSGMPKMKAGAAPAPPMAGMGMMGMMDKMMGMMDKMMGMGGGAAMPPAAPMAGAPAMAMDMDMDDKMEMPPMGGAGAMLPAAPAPAMSAGMGMAAMEMAGMMGMSPMAGGSPAAMAQSTLPGFPGASHLYHIGATGFFLDHPQHIALTLEQQAGLNQAKQQAEFAKSTADRAADQVEQELWMLTAADLPDAAKIEAKIRENEKIRSDERLAFIRAVGEASKLLTDDQRKSLTGFAPPATAPTAPTAAPMAAPGAAMPAGGMPDM